MEDERKQGPAKQAPSKQGRGNFAQDRERAAEAGRKGGQASNRGGTNKGNFANDRERAREAGRKGGRR
jgi:general stress protein YciG